MLRAMTTALDSAPFAAYIFNLAVCNAFGVYIGLDRTPIEWRTAGEGMHIGAVGKALADA